MIKISIVLIIIFVTTLMVFGTTSYLYFSHDLPSIGTLKNYKTSMITKFFSENG